MSSKYFAANVRRGGAAGTAVFLALGLSACGNAEGSSAEGEPFTPSENVSLIIHADAGGSSDLMGRQVAKLLDEEGIVDQPVLPENRPGGSGAVAYSYLLQQSGNPHVLATLSSSYLTTPVSGQADYTYEDFTNLAVLATDGLVLAVDADSDIQTLDDLVSQAEENPNEVVFAGTQTGGADSIVRYLLEEETGATFRYVSFDGGGEVNAAVLGGNADVIAANPAEIAGLIESGDLRALATTLPERLEGLDVPTATEEGVDLVFTQSRGILAPPDLTAEQTEFWTQAMAEMADSQAWQDYLADNMLYPEVHVGEDAEAYIAEEWDKYVEVLGALGVTEE